MVRAWASANNMALGQVKVDEKSNDITAIPKLLDLIVVEVCIVTIAAMGCQEEVTRKIKKEEAYYVGGLKTNYIGLWQLHFLRMLLDK